MTELAKYEIGINNFEDNTSMIIVPRNDEVHRRSRHADPKKLWMWWY